MTEKRIKEYKIIFIVVSIVIILGMVGSLLFSFRSYQMMKEVIKLEKKEDNLLTQEDDVVIMNNYKIVSTLPISNAYKSGKTSNLDDRDKETLDLASAVLDTIITDGMTDYEKEKAVYDWMCKNIGEDTGMLTVIPSSDEDSDKPYGVLKYGNAVCVGYATTFRLFMQMLGIDCMVVHNTDCFHSWNLVKIDGEWYHTDVYSDAGKDDYESFNMNDIICAQKSTWDMTYFPAANALTYNIAYQNMVTLTDIYDLPDTLRAAIDDGQSALFIRMEEEPDQETMIIGNYMVDCLSDFTLISRTGKIFMDYHGWMSDPKDNATLMYISMTCEKSAAASTILDPEMAEEIDVIIDETFADMLTTPDYDSDDNFDDVGEYEEYDSYEDAGVKK